MRSIARQSVTGGYSKRFSSTCRSYNEGLNYRLALSLAVLLVSFASPVRAADSMPATMLAAHNFYRRQVGTPPLVWSTRLATLAQDWANYLIRTGVYKHRPDGQYGENLFEVVGPPADERQVVNAWAAERAGYDRRRNSCSGKCGHYTQIIWRDTRRVGCGAAQKNRREIWVCNYDPPGNIIGERPY